MTETNTRQEYIKGVVKFAAIFYGVILGISLLWIWLSENNFKFSFYHNSLKILLVTVTIVIATVGLSTWLAITFQWARCLEAEFYKLFGSLDKKAFMLLALFSGIGEEFLFRGAMQPAFGYVLTSLLFGCIHFIPNKAFLPWTVFAIIMGFVLGWLYMYSDNLLFPVFAHFLINYFNILGICQRQKKYHDSAIEGESGMVDA